MPESLIETLPKIVSEGKKEVEKILKKQEGDNKLLLQTNEYVLPSKENITTKRACGAYTNKDK